MPEGDTGRGLGMLHLVGEMCLARDQIAASANLALQNSNATTRSNLDQSRSSNQAYQFDINEATALNLRNATNSDTQVATQGQKTAFAFPWPIPAKDVGGGS